MKKQSIKPVTVFVSVFACVYLIGFTIIAMQHSRIASTNSDRAELSANHLPPPPPFTFPPPPLASLPPNPALQTAQMPTLPQPIPAQPIQLPSAIPHEQFQFQQQAAAPLPIANQLPSATQNGTDAFSQTMQAKTQAQSTHPTPNERRKKHLRKSKQKLSSIIAETNEKEIMIIQFKKFVFTTNNIEYITAVERESQLRNIKIFIDAFDSAEHSGLLISMTGEEQAPIINIMDQLFKAFSSSVKKKTHLTRTNDSEIILQAIKNLQSASTALQTLSAPPRPPLTPTGSEHHAYSDFAEHGMFRTPYSPTSSQATQNFDAQSVFTY